MRLLPENEQTWELLQEIISRYGVQGKQIHDAHLIATSRSSDVTQLVTENTGDFARFSPEMEILDLATVAAV